MHAVCLKEDTLFLATNRIIISTILINFYKNMRKYSSVIIMP